MGLWWGHLATSGTGLEAVGGQSAPWGVVPREVRGGKYLMGTYSFLSPQFETGPYGCVLLTLSAILSRSTEL